MKEKLEDLRSLMNGLYREGTSLTDDKMLKLSQRFDKIVTNYHRSTQKRIPTG
ncbi:aspartyl-phosphate phosphatase Spo0E family protein [Paenibacillus sp. ACRRX]|uniref:aspartyl-phosphate phosphatase Spo0E family protein n=1 Tax=unclassified Paenibacillus TaxID=185978 RepID=UPI001EF499E0|nr:aspartyl-phosphate phosphatase Spo0E family protein [Paenibacillus sp. UMB4589-SE434]MCG7405891.1 aspartyl-phosphate phosphatase Spo0E family protein [Paenibacillus sp. ACRRX]MDK8182342.1 aspartyl-phosphate phosphatase Spo0E family protein [Paenibacillus sp. UMB4589-SE434]